MRVLGIDQSYTSTGVVLVEDGVVKLALTVSSSVEDTMFVRAWNVAMDLCTLVEHTKPDKIIIEGLPFGKIGNATRDLAGLQYIVVSTITQAFNNVPEIVSPTTLKKFATGSGKSTKKDMKAAIPSQDRESLMSHRKFLSKEFEDVADAYWLAHYGLK